MTDIGSLLDQIGKLKIWHKGGVRAPHKPLLMLYALGQFSQGKDRLLFSEVDLELRTLLKWFGPGLKYIHTEYPFWRFQNDGLWIVTADEPIESGSRGTDARKSELIRKKAVGALADQVTRVLKSDPNNLRLVTSALLENNFPETIHQDILDAVGLRLDAPIGPRQRSPQFRRRVLRAYESRCCVCGYDLRIGDIPAGIEAAHIMWHQAGGPDIESNGLALCTLHHKIFDLGGFTVYDDRLTLVFSQDISGVTRRDWLMGFHGKSLLAPQSETLLPDPKFLAWHRDTIFRSPGREFVARDCGPSEGVEFADN